MILNSGNNTMNRSSTVAVILTTHNRSLPILKRALNSVFSQTRAASKIIIVDTNTNSAVSSAISDYINSIRTADLELIQLPGKSNNYGRNHGATLAGGDYIAFLDDDDEWFPRKLEGQMGMIDENISIVHSNYEIENAGGDITQLFDCMPEVDGLNIRILGENIIGCTSMPLVSSKVFFEEGRFDESLESNQDWDLWIRILQRHDAKYCSEIAGVKHYSAESISNNKRRRVRGWIRLLMKHARLYRKNPEQFAIATGFFSGEMFSKKLYLTGTAALMIHFMFRTVYLKNEGRE